MIARTCPAQLRDNHAQPYSAHVTVELVYHDDDPAAMTLYAGPDRIKWTFARELLLHALLCWEPYGDGDVVIGRDGEGRVVFHLTSPDGEAYLAVAEEHCRGFAQAMLTRVGVEAEEGIVLAAVDEALRQILGVQS